MRSEKLPQRELTSPILLPGISAEQTGLKRLFFDELKDVYWAEKQLFLIFPKIADASSSEEFADVIMDDLAMTFEHMERLDAVFASLREKPAATFCATMAGLVAEIEKIIANGTPGTLTDAALLSVVKRIRYCQIASYGILCSFSRTLGEIKILGVMEECLEEERNSYRELMYAAKDILNG